MIHIPPHLGIETPEDMPIWKLAEQLYARGYRLVNRLDGDVEAVPITEYLPYRDEDLFRDNEPPEAA